MTNYALRIPVPGFIGKRFANKAGDALYTRLLGAIAEPERYSYPDLTLFSMQLQTYELSPWVYIAVSRIADPSALIEFEVSRVNAEHEEEEKDHPIEQLFRKPNAFFSQYEFFHKLLLHYLLTGNAYVYLGGPDGGAPDELLLLQPDRVHIKARGNNSSPVSSYVYRSFIGVDIPIPKERVIHFKRSHPSNDFYGLSPLCAIQIGIQTDLAASKWNLNFFGKNNAVPSAIVSLPSTMPDPLYDRVSREFKEEFGGTERKTAFIRGDQMKVEVLAKTHVEMDFFNALSYYKEQILNAYGVPMGVLSENSTEANSTQGNATMLDQVVYPLMISLAQKLTAELAPRYGSGLIIEPDDIRKQDTADERAEIETAKQFTTVNEVREKYYSLPPIEGGDVPAAIWNSAIQASMDAQPDAPQDSNPKPPSTSPELPEPPQPKQLPVPGETAKAIEEPEPDEDETKPLRVYYSRSIAKQITQFVKFVGHDKPFDAFRFIETPRAVDIAVKAWADVSEDIHEVAIVDPAWTMKYESRISMSGVMDDLATEKDASEAVMKQTASDYLQALLDKVIKNTRQAASNARKASYIPGNLEDYENYFDEKFWSDMLDLLDRSLRGTMQDAVLAGANGGAKRLSKIGIGLDPTVFNTDAAAYALKYTDKVLMGFNTTSRKGVGAILARWIGSEGATLQDLITAFNESPIFSLKRAELTAVTETTRAFAQGEMIAGQEIAKIAEVSFKAKGTGIEPPLHPGCRCWISTVPEYDENNRLVSFDAMYHTSRDIAVCPLCAPYNGKLIGVSA